MWDFVYDKPKINSASFGFLPTIWAEVTLKYVFAVFTKIGLHTIGLVFPKNKNIIDKRKPVSNNAHFQDIQNKIIIQLDKARVSIRMVMAWFTNEILFQKLFFLKIILMQSQMKNYSFGNFVEYCPAKYAIIIQMMMYLEITK